MLKNQLNKKINTGDFRLSYTVVAYLFIAELNTAIKTVFLLSEKIWHFLSLLFAIMIILFLLFSIKYVFKRALVFFMAGSFFIFLAFGKSIVLGFASEKELGTGFFSTYFICFTMTVYLYAINDKLIFYDALYRTSPFAVIIMICGFVFLKNGSYSMSLSYLSLPFLLVFVNEVFKKSNLLNIGLCVLSIIMIFIWGNRGALLCIMLFISIKLLFYHPNVISFFYKILIVLIFIMIIVLNQNKIILGLEQWLNEIGRSSYILNRIIDHSLAESNSRIVLYRYYWTKIYEKPFTGYGIMGGYYGAGLYPHNIIQEIFLAFGIIEGSFIVIFLFLSMAKIFIFLKNKKRFSDLYIIWFACLPSLFLSGQALQSTTFWFFLVLSWPKNKQEIWLDKKQWETA